MKNIERENLERALKVSPQRSPDHIDPGRMHGYIKPGKKRTMDGKIMSNIIKRRSQARKGKAARQIS